jgi:hypothetical protein
VGRSSPTRNSSGARGENLGEAGAEGRNYLLQLRLHHLLHLALIIHDFAGEKRKGALKD